MSSEALFRWGGVTAIVWVIVFTAMLAVTFLAGGIEWAAWIPTFSIVICLYVILLVSASEYVAKFDYPLARIGYMFGLLLMVVLFAEVAAWGTDRMITSSGEGGEEEELSSMLALFNSTHTLAIWFHGLWMGFVRGTDPLRDASC